MADVRSTAVALDVGQPLVLGRVGVTCTDVTGLQGLEVLESAELVGHLEEIGGFKVSERVWWEGDGVTGTWKS